VNQFRNEHEITLGSRKILLRPTFAAMASVEDAIKGLPNLAIRLSQGSYPTYSETTQLIFHCQAGPEKLSLIEVFDLVMGNGLHACALIMPFIAKLTAGNDKAADLTEAEKKS